MSRRWIPAVVTMERFFAPCPRGLEQALADELQRLDATAIAPADGGVAFQGARARLPREPRVAAREPHPLARRGRPLSHRAGCARACQGIAWPTHFRADRTLRVDVAATRSPLASLEFATLTIKDAIVDRFRAEAGSRPSIDKRAPDVRVHAYLTADEVTFYVDTSGDPLFKRGYRRDAEEAPIRENLAAGLVVLSGWQPGTPLLDPMCGSGTIAIEAALIASARAPGLSRTFGFQKLAWYDGPTWQRIRQKALDRVVAHPQQPFIFASDQFAGRGCEDVDERAGREGRPVAADRMRRRAVAGCAGSLPAS